MAKIYYGSLRSVALSLHLLGIFLMSFKYPILGNVCVILTISFLFQTHFGFQLKNLFVYPKIRVERIVHVKFVYEKNLQSMPPNHLVIEFN